MQQCSTRVIPTQGKPFVQLWVALTKVLKHLQMSTSGGQTK